MYRKMCCKHDALLLYFDWLKPGQGLLKTRIFVDIQDKERENRSVKVQPGRIVHLLNLHLCQLTL